MKGFAKFYFYLLLIYFPTCIAFPQIFARDWIDEVLAFFIVAIAITNQDFLVNTKKCGKEIKFYCWLMLFYVFYSMWMHITTSRGIMLDVLQQIRPYFVFYCTYMMAPNFSDQQKKWLKWSVVGSFVLYMFFYFYDVGIVDKYAAYSKSKSGEAESAPLGMIALYAGMIYYLFSNHSQRNLLVSIVILLLGLVSGKSKFIGECVVFIFIVMFIKKKVKFNNVNTVAGLVIMVVFVLIFTWSKFNAYYVEGMQERSEQLARPMTYKTAGKILVDYFPFGSGLGSFATAAAAKEYSPLYVKYHLDHIWGMSKDFNSFIADAFYPTLAEFGFFGIFMFCVFWKRRWKEVQNINNIYYYRMAIISIMALALDSTANTSYLSGHGMGFFIILAICINSNRYPEIEIQNKRKQVGFFHELLNRKSLMR